MEKIVTEKSSQTWTKKKKESRNKIPGTNVEFQNSLEIDLLNI